MAATSNDYPGLPFVQARGFTAGRRDGPPLWIVWHDMEASEHSLRAENTAAYFAAPGDGRDVSAHYSADDNSVVQSVDEDDVAWTVGNREGNYRGVNIELSGFARQTEAEWLDVFGRAMFARIAPVVAHSMQRWGIPNAWRTIADLRNLRPGHTTHRDLGTAFGGTDHTDPGPGFPRGHVLAVIQDALDGGGPLATDRDDWKRLMGYDGAVPTPANWGNPKNKELSLATAVAHLLFRAEAAAAKAAADETRAEAREARAEEWRARVAAQVAASAADLKLLGGITGQLEALVRAGGGDVDVAALMLRLDALAVIIGAGDARIVDDLRGDLTRLRQALADAEQAAADTLDQP